MVKKKLENIQKMIERLKIEREEERKNAYPDGAINATKKRIE